MPNPFKRLMAVGCTHGDLVNPIARQSVLDFKDRWQPEIRFDLGDLIDTACFRKGAAGTKDEGKSTRDDRASAVRWIEEYEPTHIAWGNHDWRLFKLLDHPQAIVRDLAGDIWNQLHEAAAKVQAKTVPYHRRKGWFHEFGYDWGHGYEFNINAVQSHTNTQGRPIVMAHIHHPQQINGRNVWAEPSFCVGGLVDEDNLSYGHERVASLTHGHGVVFGETNGEITRLWLAQSANGQPINFPPGL